VSADHDISILARRVDWAIGGAVNAAKIASANKPAAALAKDSEAIAPLGAP